MMRLRIYPAHRHRTIGHVDMPRLVRQGALLARGLPRDFPTMPYRRGTPSNDYPVARFRVPVAIGEMLTTVEEAMSQVID
jgi:hypothetical protein